jgi:hypothetical protein
MWALENGRTQFWSIKAQSGSSRGQNMFTLILLLIVTIGSVHMIVKGLNLPLLTVLSLPICMQF